MYEFISVKYQALSWFTQLIRPASRTTSQHDSECRMDLHPPAYRAPADGEARTSGISAGLVGRSIGG
jgi:hypothetical protein